MILRSEDYYIDPDIDPETEKVVLTKEYLER